MNMLTLSKFELINFLGINELRHVKDPSVKKTKGFMFGVLIFLYVVLIFYMAGQSMVLAQLGQKDYIPVLYLGLAFIANVAVGIYRAKASIYRESDLEQVSVFPVSGADIAASRIFRMYVDNLIVGIGIIIPAMIIYGIKSGCGALFYISIIPVCIISPIIPTALAALVGIIFAAIIARNRHKVLTEVILAIVIVIGSFAVSGVISAKTGLTGGGFGAASKEEINEQINEELSRMMTEKLGSMESGFPLMKIMGEVLRDADYLGILIYALISLAVLIPTVIVIGKNFFSISKRLFVTQAHREYKMEELHQQSVLTALVKKEAARYFSSGIYVSNTIVNPVLVLVMAVALGFVDLNKVMAEAGELPINMNPYAAIPFFMGMIFCMTSIASSSVSMEGKNWWIMRTLPLSAKDILGAKLLFNLIFLAPFYALTEIIMLFTVNAGFVERLWLIIIPALSIIYSVLLGLFLNLKFPKFNWENDTEVVKQSAAVGLGMLGTIPVLLFAVAAMIVPGAGIHLLSAGFVVIVSVISLLLYRSICNTKLEKLF